MSNFPKYFIGILENYFKNDDTSAIVETIRSNKFHRTPSNESALKEYGNSKLTECIFSLWEQLHENESPTSGVDSNSSSTTHIGNNFSSIPEGQKFSSTEDTRVQILEKRIRELELKLQDYQEKEEKANNEKGHRKEEMQPETEVYIHLADPSYEKDYLPIMETILSDAYKVPNPEVIYQEKNVHRYGKIGASSCPSSKNLPPPGSIVLYVLFLTANRFDDIPKAQFLSTLIGHHVNVIVCLFRRARGAYLDVEEIVARGEPVLTIPFMVNKKMLSHEVPDLSTKEKDSLEPGYAKSLHNLQKELGLSEPKSENRTLFEL